jgi:hypothetical protein
MNQFELQPYRSYDKRIVIKGPHDLLLYVDHDDVNTDVVDELVPVMVTLLNQVWNLHARTIKLAVDRGEAKGRQRWEEEEREYAE